jgi:hypothetical protein
VNHLFKADFFGEKALLSDEPRCCTLQHDPAQHLMVNLLSSPSLMNTSCTVCNCVTRFWSCNASPS